MGQRVRHMMGAAALTLTLGLGPGLANDQALYDQAPPADAAFVRVLGPVADQGLRLPLGGGSIWIDPQMRGTYLAVAATDLTAVEPGGFYSAVIGADGAAQLIAEPARSTAAKVHLILVNGSDRPVRLRVADGGPEVVTWLAPGQSASRAVNPVTAQLVVEHEGATDPATPVTVTLSRGQNLTFFADAGGRAEVIENTFGPVLQAQ